MSEPKGALGESVDGRSPFKDAKDKYIECRRDERKKIIDALADAKYEVLKTRGGRGRSNYGKNRLSAPYDLTNWQWVEAQRDGCHFLVCLQAFDIDPSSKNLHVLYDRVAIHDLDTGKQTMTRFDLPLSSSDLVDLVDEITRLTERCRERSDARIPRPKA